MVTVTLGFQEMLGAGTVAFTALYGLGKLLLQSYVKRIKERFVVVESAFGRESEKFERLERELLELKALLPEKYVAREDWVKSQSRLELKLEKIISAIYKMEAPK